ncbi:MAG: sialate O-acetylesterase [Armatimonadota bacterium]
MLISTPVPYQVIQRQNYVIAEDNIHHLGGPALGYAQVLITCTCPEKAGVWTWEYLVRPLKEATGTGVSEWTPLTGKTADGVFRGTARIPAGGWYRLEVRCREGEQVRGTAGIEPIGVGEVLLIAGQSYSEGCNAELLRVADPQARVTAYDLTTHSWRVAHDPLPNCNPGGTIWPPLGDMLVALLRVPVGIVDVGVGATASRQWMPGQEYYLRLATAGRKVGPCRMLLWQQGESDVIEGVEADTYVHNITTIRTSLVKEWGFAPSWLPAKSTLHPYVYQNPAGEGIIRGAIGRLWQTPGFLPGPDTDILSGENRADLALNGHFTGLGQRRAALLWFASVWNALQTLARINRD